MRRRRYQQRLRDLWARSAAPVRLRAGGSGKLHAQMLAPADALGYTVSLLAVFGGIGILANVLIVYTVAQVLAERRANEERKERTGG